jgi:phosphoenolpyruvate carboxykinase (ATP)
MLSTLLSSNAQILINPSLAVLVEEAIRLKDCNLVNSGALVALSGQRTGRSPGDKRIVENCVDVEWGPINQPISVKDYSELRKTAQNWLCQSQKPLYVIDSLVNADERNQFRVRVICSRPYHALFAHTMFIRPAHTMLAIDHDTSSFNPHFTIINAGEFPAPRIEASHLLGGVAVCLDLPSGEILISTNYCYQRNRSRIVSIIHSFCLVFCFSLALAPPRHKLWQWGRNMLEVLAKLCWLP